MILSPWDSVLALPAGHSPASMKGCGDSSSLLTSEWAGVSEIIWIKSTKHYHAFRWGLQGEMTLTENTRPQSRWSRIRFQPSLYCIKRISGESTDLLKRINYSLSLSQEPKLQGSGWRHMVSATLTGGFFPGCQSWKGLVHCLAQAPCLQVRKLVLWVRSRKVTWPRLPSSGKPMIEARGQKNEDGSPLPVDGPQAGLCCHLLLPDLHSLPITCSPH